MHFIKTHSPAAPSQGCSITGVSSEVLRTTGPSRTTQCSPALPPQRLEAQLPFQGQVYNPF